MSIANLTYLFKPKSVAVLGASVRQGAVSALICRNLLQGGFAGPIMPVNPNHLSVSGVLAYPDVDHLPIVPELAVICTPPHIVPGLIDDLIRKGTRAVIIITAGLNREVDENGRILIDVILEKARAVGMRILGPNCLGLMVPGIGLNASFSHVSSKAGRIAFVSQSGAMCTAVLDWANAQGIGFSHFISLGDASDLDFGDIIDYLGMDPETQAILLYIESIQQRRNFMSAARSAARNKPILVIKSGRFPEGVKAAASHTGALAGADEVYTAAFRRSGMLRVHDVTELFAAVETLARARPLKGERLCIVTNGGGIGVIAIDSLVEMGGRVATLSQETIRALDAELPATWSRSNPVDIIGDAPGQRYKRTVEILAAAEEVDAILVMHAPTAVADSSEAARATIDAAKNTKDNVLTCWLGKAAVADAKRLFHEAGIPTHESPEQAIAAFMHMVRYQNNQKILMEAPDFALEDFSPDVDTARSLIETALASGVSMMDEAASKALLAAYGIPVVQTRVAKTPIEAETISQDLTFPVALKILSPDITHKSDMGGVKLFLQTPQKVGKAAVAMLEHLEKVMPGANIHGFTVQEMAVRPGAHELILGMASDPIFGPVLMFGQGGTAVEVIGDSAMELPPLNVTLARAMISRTRISRLLQGYRDRKAVNMNELCSTLLKLSQIVVDIPEIVELDINPLFADERGVIAVDARIRVSPKYRAGVDSQRLAIRAYPKSLEEDWRMKNGTEVLLRPIRPEDEPQHHEFLAKLSPEDMRSRFLPATESLPRTEMVKLTQIDYNREMAFIASAVHATTGKRETLGVNRMFTDLCRDSCEFAIVVRSDLKGQGLGGKLMEKMIRYCKSRNIKSMEGFLHPTNMRMLEFVKQFGFSTEYMEKDKLVKAVKVID